MPFKSRRAKLILNKEEINKLEKIISSRTEGVSRVERAKIFLFYHQGEDDFSYCEIVKD